MYTSVRSTKLLGPLATLSAIQSKYPAASYTGCVALVGSTAPYRQYVSDGSTWTDKSVNFTSSEVVDSDNIPLARRAGLTNRNRSLYNLEAPIVIPSTCTVGPNGSLQIGVKNTTISLTLSATSGTNVTCTASAAFFTTQNDSIKKYICLPSGEWLQITGFTSTTGVTVTILNNGGTLTSGTGPHTNWWFGHGTPSVYGVSGYVDVSVNALGCWMYFLADTLYPGSVAGTYWTVMRSPMRGTVYNTRPATNTIASIPRTAVTPIVSATTVTQSLTNTSYTISGSVTIPAGIMGVDGAVTCYMAGSMSPNSDTTNVVKSIFPYIGSTYSGRAYAYAGGGYYLRSRWNSKGTYGIMGCSQGWGGEQDTSGSHDVGGLIYTGLPMSFTLRANPYASTECITIDSLRLELNPGTTGMSPYQPPVTYPITVPTDFMGMNLMQPGVGSFPDISTVAAVGITRLNQSQVARWYNVETSAGVYSSTVLASLGAAITAVKAKGGKVALGLYGTPTFYAQTAARPIYADSATKGPWGALGECSNPTSMTAVTNFVTYMINYFNKPGGTWYDANGGKKGIDYWETWNEPENYQNNNGNLLGTAINPTTGVSNDNKGVGFWWGSSAELVDLCKLQYDLIKSLDPSVVIWSPGFASVNNVASYFLAATGNTYSSTKGSQTFDQFSFHCYHAAPPGDPYGVGNGDVITGKDGLHAQLTHLHINGYDFPMTIGEIGIDPKGTTDSQAWYLKSAAQRYTYWCRVAMVCAAWGMKSILPWHWGETSNTQGNSGNWYNDTDGCTKAYNDITSKLSGKTITACTYEFNSPVRLDFSDGTSWVV